MPTYNDIITRDDAGDAIVPVETSNQIIQELPQQSVVLTRGQQVTMSSKVRKQPVLASLPIANWVGGDTGMKQTTKVTWENLVITAEELAALVPIPDALIQDSSVPLWDQVRPLLVEAIGKKVDEAAIFGIDKPASWPTALVPGAIAAGNVVEDTTGTAGGLDLAGSVAKLGQTLAEDGYAATGFASAPGFNWRLVGLRDTTGAPVYTPSLAEGAPSTLYGYPLNEVQNGAWNSAAALLLAADWTKVVVGVRQDFTWKLFDQMVISDEEGKVIFNSAQQDSQIMRVVFRCGVQIANPLTRVNDDDASRYPAAVLTPKAA